MSWKLLGEHKPPRAKIHGDRFSVDVIIWCRKEKRKLSGYYDFAQKELMDPEGETDDYEIWHPMPDDPTILPEYEECT